jgi:hypothetical protein
LTWTYASRLPDGDQLGDPEGSITEGAPPPLGDFIELTAPA